MPTKRNSNGADANRREPGTHASGTSQSSEKEGPASRQEVQSARDLKAMKLALEGPRVVQQFGGSIFPPLTPGWPLLVEIRQMEGDDIRNAYLKYVVPREKKIAARNASKADIGIVQKFFSDQWG
jgi:hypothetical protein